MGTRFRLRGDLVVEPLVSHWNAWWLTTAPVPSALQAHNYQIPVLKSFLQNPDFHFRAASDPSLAGTSFVAISPTQVDTARALLDEMERGFPESAELATALDDLQKTIAQLGQGQSLEPLYARVPPALKGLVELAYDYLNRPSIRILEGLTYKTSYFKRHLQSFRISRATQDIARPFFLSTPRLRAEGDIDWPIAFDDPRVDELFASDVEGLEANRIAGLLNAPNPEAIASAIEEAAPSKTEARSRFRYLGHACVLIETPRVSIMTDPFLPSARSASGERRVSFSDLPKRLDYVLITHAHADHYQLETLLRLRHRIGTLVVPKSHGVLVGDVSLKLMSQNLGFKNVYEIDAMESLSFADGAITAVPFLGEHGDLLQGKSAYVVRVGSEQTLFAADSACLDESVYTRLKAALGPIQTVFLNTEALGSPLTFSIEAVFPRTRDRRAERTRRCRGSNADEGIRLLNAVGAQRMFNYAMGLEPWLSVIIGPPEGDDSPRMRESAKLIASARAAGIATDCLRGQRDIDFISSA